MFLSFAAGSRRLGLASLLLVSACATTGGRPTPAATPADPGAAPEGFLRVDVLGIIPGPEGQALFLVEPTTHRVLPIWIGKVEALSIQLRLDRKRFERPLTHDLIDQILEHFDARVARVQIDAVHQGTFVATLTLDSNAGTVRLDARPSDAIALALSGRAPIFVSRRVIEQAGLSQETLEKDPTLLLPTRSTAQMPVGARPADPAGHAPSHR